MNLFGNSNLTIVELGMLSYPVIGLTLEAKLNLLKKKGFSQMKNEESPDLIFEKRSDEFLYEKIINSGRYCMIEIPPFIEELAFIVNDDTSWYNYYETNSLEKFESLFRYKEDEKYLIYYIKTKDKIISYYRINVWATHPSRVVVLEVIHECKTIFSREDKFYIRSFLSASDYKKDFQYSNELIKLPIDKRSS